MDLGNTQNRFSFYQAFHERFFLKKFIFFEKNKLQRI